MNSDLEHLIVLQSQDLELKHLRQELVDAPLRVAAAQSARNKADKALLTAKAALQKEEVLRRSQQSDVADKQGKIARLRKQMETATSAAQITARPPAIRNCRKVHPPPGMASTTATSVWCTARLRRSPPI